MAAKMNWPRVQIENRTRKNGYEWISGGSKSPATAPTSNILGSTLPYREPMHGCTCGKFKGYRGDHETICKLAVRTASRKVEDSVTGQNFVRNAPQILSAMPNCTCGKSVGFLHKHRKHCLLSKGSSRELATTAGSRISKNPSHPQRGNGGTPSAGVPTDTLAEFVKVCRAVRKLYALPDWLLNLMKETVDEPTLSASDLKRLHHFIEALDKLVHVMPE
jgi:hypothetical protein